MTTVIGRRMGRNLANGVAAVCLLAGVAQAAEFSDTQRKEIGEIVREYLLANPEVLREVSEALDAKERAAQAEMHTKGVKENADAIFRSPDDLIAGNPEGKITMVEFFDYNCSWCKKGVSEVLSVLEKDKDVRLVLKEFPIFGEDSEYAAKAAIAAGKQGKYWELHLALLQHEGQVDKAAVDEIAKAQGLDMDKLHADMADPAVAEILKRNGELAAKLGVSGTPAFVIDETLIPGYLPHDNLLAKIQSVRDNGGCKLC